MQHFFLHVKFCCCCCFLFNECFGVCANVFCNSFFLNGRSELFVWSCVYVCSINWSKKLEKITLLFGFYFQIYSSLYNNNTITHSYTHKQVSNQSNYRLCSQKFLMVFSYSQLSSDSQYLSFTLRGFFRSHRTLTRKYATNAINTIFLNYFLLLLLQLIFCRFFFEI